MVVAVITTYNARKFSLVTPRYLFSTSSPSGNVDDWSGVRRKHVWISTKRAAGLAVARYQITDRSWLARSNASLSC